MNPALTLTERLAQCYTGAVHDVLRMMGFENVVLPPEIKAIAPGTRLAGPVWTVSGHIDRTKTREMPARRHTLGMEEERAGNRRNVQLLIDNLGNGDGIFPLAAGACGGRIAVAADEAELAALE